MPSLTFTVAGSANDWTWGGAGIFSNTGDLQVKRSFTTAQSFGFRCQNVTVPQGSIIDDAYFTVTQYTSNAGSINTNIKAFKLTNASAPANYSDASSTTRTTASVSWTPDGGQAQNTTQQSPGIASVIQEITDQGGWASGNALVICVDQTGTGSDLTNSFYSWDLDSAKAPSLTITWTENPANRTASGGVVVGGTATNTHRIAQIASGGVVASGQGVRGYSNTASGGGLCGGSCVVNVIITRTVSGGVVCSGTASRSLTIIATGGAVCSGTASTTKINRVTASGGAVVGYRRQYYRISHNSTAKMHQFPLHANLALTTDQVFIRDSSGRILPHIVRSFTGTRLHLFFRADLSIGANVFFIYFDV